MKKKKIIITGISGFIGSHLAEYLRKKYKIIGIDRKECVQHKDVDVYIQDINDEPMYKDKVYAVIHLAAKAGVRESQDGFEEYVHDNILGTKSILDNCIKYWEPNKICIASSSSIYGDGKDGYNPKSLYAASKVMTEQIVNSYRNSNMLSNMCCMRFFTVYGPKQRKGLAMREFIDKILRDESITVYGDGTQRRDFTFIDDLCEAIERELNEKFTCNNLDAGSGRSISLNEVIYTISKLTDKNININYEPWNKHDVYETCSKSSFITDPTPLEEGLRKQIEWQKKLI